MSGLAVPFELGRPMGVPNDPAFQRRVLLGLRQQRLASENPVIKHLGQMSILPHHQRDKAG